MPSLTPMATPRKHPAEAAGQHGERERSSPRVGRCPDEHVVDLIAQEHAERPADAAEDDAVGRQPGEADQRAVADGLDADDEVADGAADERAAQEGVEVLRGGRERQVRHRGDDRAGHQRTHAAEEQERQQVGGRLALATAHEHEDGNRGQEAGEQRDEAADDRDAEQRQVRPLSRPRAASAIERRGGPSQDQPTDEGRGNRDQDEEKPKQPAAGERG